MGIEVGKQSVDLHGKFSGHGAGTVKRKGPSECLGFALLRDDDSPCVLYYSDLPWH